MDAESASSGPPAFVSGAKRPRQDNDDIVEGLIVEEEISEKKNGEGRSAAVEGTFDVPYRSGCGKVDTLGTAGAGAIMSVNATVTAGNTTQKMLVDIHACKVRKTNQSSLTKFFKAKPVESHVEMPKKPKKLDQIPPQLKLEMDTMGSDWFEALFSEMSKEYFVNIKMFLEKEKSQHAIYPPEEDMYSFSRFSQLKNIKVVILGQDPYHGPGQAHGLCFSVKKGISPPPSLVNIYKELKNDIEGFQIPSHGCLESWAKQGVLLLNASLTVRARNANSHSNIGWQRFTDAIIAYLNAKLNGLVFMLWGSYAQKKSSMVDSRKHLMLKAVHPSPLSAHKGFFGCKHFSKANDWLKKNGKGEVDWRVT